MKENDHGLTAEQKEQRLQAMRDHFGLTDEEMLAQFEKTGVIEDPREPTGTGTSPHVIEWLILLGKEDML